jgi:hypothetical protein
MMFGSAQTPMMDGLIRVALPMHPQVHVNSG